jgi:hypothetical protein
MVQKKSSIQKKSSGSGDELRSLTPSIPRRFEKAHAPVRRMGSLGWSAEMWEVRWNESTEK